VEDGGCGGFLTPRGKGSGLKGGDQHQQQLLPESAGKAPVAGGVEERAAMLGVVESRILSKIAAVCGPTPARVQQRRQLLPGALPGGAGAGGKPGGGLTSSSGGGLLAAGAGGSSMAGLEGAVGLAAAAGDGWELRGESSGVSIASSGVSGSRRGTDAAAGGVAASVGKLLGRGGGVGSKSGSMGGGGGLSSRRGGVFKP
jgi:hypothetical protein